MAHRHKVHRAKGGSVYSGAGSNVIAEARKDDSEGFKHGGRHHAGHAYGGKSKKRADRYARGGRSKSPFSAASSGIKGPRGFAAAPMKRDGGHGKRHQYAEGGKVKDDDGEDCGDKEEDGDGYKKGGGLKMHFRGGKQRHAVGAKLKSRGGHVDNYETHGGVHFHKHRKGGKAE